MAVKGDNGLLTMDLFKVIQDFPMQYPYRGMVQYISTNSRLSAKEFNNMNVSKHFWIDTRNCRRERKVNKQCIFELFRAISQETASEVRANLVERIRLDSLYYKRVGHVIMGFQNCTLNEWCNAMEKSTTGADELAIFALSKIYQRHTVIFNSSKPWTTLEPNAEMLEDELYEHCQIHLVYTGKCQYATLHRKPFSVQQAPPSLKSMQSLMRVKRSSKRSCQQIALDLSLRPDKSTDTSCEVEPLNPTIDTCDSSIPDTGLLGDNEVGQPTKLERKDRTEKPSEENVSPKRQRYLNALGDIRKTWSEVKLFRLKPSDVDFYLNKASASKVDNNFSDLSSSPICVSRAGRPLRTRLTANAENAFLDSDNDSDSLRSPIKKPIRFTPRASGPSASRVAAQNKHSGIPDTSLPSSIQVYARSDSPVYSECDHESDVDNCSESSSGSSKSYEPSGSDYDSSDTFEGFGPEEVPEPQPSPPKKGKGSLNTVHFGLRRRKRVRNYRCQQKDCQFLSKSLRDLNDHHVNNHDPVCCKGCDKTFKTPSSMKRHAYSHGKLSYVCNVCNSGFAFRSELNFHKTVHRTVSSYHCVSKGCGKSFKSSNELNKHAQKHLGVSWECNMCDYSTNDRRNLRADSKKHMKVGVHKCAPCNKSFHYFMQLKRHRAKPGCLGNGSE